MLDNIGHSLTGGLHLKLRRRTKDIELDVSLDIRALNSEAFVGGFLQSKLSGITRRRVLDNNHEDVVKGNSVQCDESSSRKMLRCNI